MVVTDRKVIPGLAAAQKEKAVAEGGTAKRGGDSLEEVGVGRKGAEETLVKNEVVVT